MATNDKEITGNKDLKVSEALLKKSKNFMRKLMSRQEKPL